MLDAIRSLFSAPKTPVRESSAPPDIDPVHLAACSLLLEVAYADGVFSQEERAHLEQVLERHFSLPPASGHRLIELAEKERRGSIDHFQFTRVLNERYDIGQKMVLAEVMWGVILADGQIATHEGWLVRKLAHLLELEPGYLAEAKRAASQG